MDRAFLESQGITDKDVIGRILSQNGAETSALTARINAKDAEINTLRGDLTTANSKIADLSKVDVADLQNQLNAEKEGRKTDRRNYALDAVLAKAGCTDPEYIKYKLGTTVKFTDDDKVDDADNAAKDWAEKFPNWFKTEDNTPGGTGSTGAGNRQRGTTPEKDNPYTKAGWNFTEQARLETFEPEKARKLAAEAAARK